MSEAKMTDVIAIDGPAASGKSTVARRVAEAMDARYVDSGALYRAVAWRVLEAGVDPRDADGVAAMVLGVRMDFVVDGKAVGFRVDDLSPGMALRAERVNQAVSPVAANPAVRVRVTGWLRGMTALGSLRWRDGISARLSFLRRRTSSIWMRRPRCGRSAGTPKWCRWRR